MTPRLDSVGNRKQKKSAADQSLVKAYGMETGLPMGKAIKRPRSPLEK
ncbi:hypothetical protein [Lentibacillus amyloliquefaciens]|nr:hypothetical protein [Lentibacillus amyloliquefaciens]